MNYIHFILFNIFLFYNLHSLSAQAKTNTLLNARLDTLSKIEQQKLEHYPIKGCGFDFDLRSALYGFDVEKLKKEYPNLSVAIIYTDSMRNRILSLLNNEYSEIELDTLVERAMKRTVKQQAQAMDLCQFDTLSIYKERLKTYYARLKEEKKNKGESVGYDYFYKYDVFELLGFDTTTCYKKAYDSLCIEERKELREMYQNHQYDKTDLIRLVGYIQDSRFIAPLERFYQKGSSEERRDAYQALMRMRIEPYYAQYLKDYSYSLNDIKEGKFYTRECFEHVVPETLSNVIISQESFLELSKYLFSTAPGNPCISDILNLQTDRGYMYDRARELILYNILNKDLQEKWGMYYFQENYQKLSPKQAKKLRSDLYDWMQKNYGKYEILEYWW